MVQIWKHRLDGCQQLGPAFWLLGRACGLLFVLPTIAWSQDPSRFKQLSEFQQAADTKAYQKELAAGGSFTESHRKLLIADGLPQLFAEANRDNIAYVRDRLPALLLEPIADKAAHQKAAAAAVEGLVELARSDRIAIEGSVNAALMLGELREQDGQPLALATPALEQLVLAENVTPAVRIAALKGLEPRVEAAGGGGSETAEKTAVALLPTLGKILGETGGEDPEDVQALLDPTVQDWLQQRAVDLVFDIASLVEANSEPLVTIEQKSLQLLGNTECSIDLRVRAAALLARRVRPDGGPSADEVIDQIDAVAVAAVVQDRAALKLIKLERSLGGGGFQDGASFAAESAMMEPGMMPGSGMMLGPGGAPVPPKPSLLPEATCLRTSWRLACLAEALAIIAETLGDKGEPLKQRAERLRGLGLAIYEKPGDEAVLAAAAELAPEPKAAETAEKPAATDQPGTPVGRPNSRPATPFSPFMNR